jgi:putative ABC transport system permease protein
VIAPFTTVQERMLTITYINSIMVSATTEKMIPEATDEITQVLKERHRLGPSEDPDFTIRSQADIASAATATSGILTILLASIASISLLVGGIGIMNIMLVSVTERTREIVIGGIIGVGIGILTSQVIAGIMKWPVTITLQSIILSFLFSTAIGIFFGWYPARKAASLNPIDALRYE